MSDRASRGLPLDLLGRDVLRGSQEASLPREVRLSRGPRRRCRSPAAWGSPLGVRITFWGLRSRWMIPRRWASERPSAIPRQDFDLLPQVGLSPSPSRIHWLRVLPGMYSMVRKERSRQVPRSKTRTTLGWVIFRVSLISLRNRALDASSMSGRLRRS